MIFVERKGWMLTFKCDLLFCRTPVITVMARTKINDQMPMIIMNLEYICQSLHRFVIFNTNDSKCRLFHERWVIARAHAHAHLEMSRQAKNCPANKQQIARLECFYFLQA